MFNVPLRHYKNQSIRSNILNIWLRFKAWQRSNRNTSNHLKVQPPSEYTLRMFDPCQKFDTNRWRTGHPWGRVHAKQLWRYWPGAGDTPPTPTVSDRNEGLELKVLNYPKTFYKSELPRWQQDAAPYEWTPRWATGLISSKQSWQWGWFEAEIQLPVQRNSWSAFWLMGSESWPPEIDIFEAYTDADPESIRIEPNLHFGEVGNTKFPKTDFGAPEFQVRGAQQDWIQYACHWTADFIRIYYDGRLVLECTEPAILEQFSAPQYITINNGCKDPEATGIIPSEGTMKVKNIKVYQK